MEQYQSEIPLFSKEVPVLPVLKKRGKERYGSLIVSTIIVVLISMFSLRTGMFESALVIPWTDMVKLIPENPGEAAGTSAGTGGIAPVPVAAFPPVVSDD
jgi:hypothetical protein